MFTNIQTNFFWKLKFWPNGKNLLVRKNETFGNPLWVKLKQLALFFDWRPIEICIATPAEAQPMKIFEKHFLGHKLTFSAFFSKKKYNSIKIMYCLFHICEPCVYKWKYTFYLSQNNSFGIHRSKLLYWEQLFCMDVPQKYQRILLDSFEVNGAKVPYRLLDRVSQILWDRI